MKKIVILTGAGISAESGLSTFRDSGGIWDDYAIKDVATPDAFLRNPALVHEFYNLRRANLDSVSPNKAHLALARLEAAFPGDVLIITQNVDDLHTRAGSTKLVQMHGTLKGALCHDCAHRWAAPLIMRHDDQCPSCANTSTRPDIVWFGEVPYGADVIDPALNGADMFVSIGTSGNVYPAAAYAQHCGRLGAHTVELNLEPSVNRRDFAEIHYGPATQLVPRWVDQILKRT